MADEKQIVREVTIEGVVHEIDGETARVILDVDGNYEQRLMDSEKLYEIGVTHEGQSFYLRGREYTDGSKEIYVEPCGDPTKVTIVNIRPDLDLSKLKRLG